MVVDDFNVGCVFAVPAETYPPLIIDANAVLAGAIAFERFQAISGRNTQITQVARAMNLREFTQSHSLDLWRQAVIGTPLP